MHDHLPDIHLFNPTCEYAAANGSPSWQPNRKLQKMERDLEALPLCLAEPKDIILVQRIAPAEFYHSLEKLSIIPPRFMKIDQIHSTLSFIEEPKNRLIPWGWSPAAHRLLNPLKNSCSEAFKRSPVFDWRSEHRSICSRKMACGILSVLQKELPDDLVIQEEFLPVICSSGQELREVVNRMGRCMVKAPWSSSGRGLQPLSKRPVVEKVWAKLYGIINDQGYAVVEPLLSKVLDLAFLFEMKKGEVSFSGVSRFHANDKGQYQGNYLNGWPIDTDPEAVKLAESLPQILLTPMISALEKSPLKQYYEGPLGVDVLIYKDSDRQLRVNPCLEINVKQTMGQLALRLQKLISPNRKGTYNLFYQPGVPFVHFKQKMETNHPARFINGKLNNGFFALTPPHNDAEFGAYILMD